MVTRNCSTVFSTVPSPERRADVSRHSQSILVIGVKYRAEREAERYLESLRGLQGEQQLTILVVDNTLGGRWFPHFTDPRFTTISVGTNLGYFGGARYGLSWYLRHNPLPDWVIVSNVDLAIPNPRFFDGLEGLASIPDLGVVAPRIRSVMTGVDQNPFMTVRPSAKRMHKYKWLFRHWLLLNAYEGLGWLYRRFRGSLRSSSSRQAARETIYAPHGSFLMFSRHYFERGGDLHFPEFLFGEEIYVAESVRRLGLRVVYDPSLVVVHQEHRSTKLFKSREIAAYVARSAKYCADTYFPMMSKT